MHEGSSSSNNMLMMNLSLQQHQMEEERGEHSSLSQSQQQQQKRRDFLRNSLSLFIATSTVVSSSSKAEAMSTSGYIPDMVGGYRKPKGVGGLTKKIRKVGDIMVSEATFTIYSFGSMLCAKD